MHTAEQEALDRVAAFSAGWDAHAADQPDKQSAFAALKLDVDTREYVKRKERLDAEDAATTPNEGVTLADLVAVFSDTVTILPTPAVLERKDGDNSVVIPAGKLSWMYSMPGGGKSFIGEIACHESLQHLGRAIYLDYEDKQETFHERGAMLGFNPNDYKGDFKYIAGGLADYPHLMPEVLDWLDGAVDPTMNMIVIDAAESSGCPSDGKDINPWLSKVVFPWKAYGTLVLDHVPKTKG